MEERLQIEEIIKGCKRNDKRMQKELYNTYAPKLFAVCLSYSFDYEEAQDNLHDGFVKILTGIKQYKGKGSFEGWMRRIVVNTSLERYRRKVKMSIISAEIRTEVTTKTEHIVEELSEADILDAINRLTPQYRMVFMLYVVEGYSHKEIGELLSISEGTSKSNLSRARAILQKRLKEYDPEYTEAPLLMAGIASGE